ncbi:MarR family transcriptional regulator [Klugiella xanthotipulae]|uniref:DNA-binding MarR family transcriptional regulator n=1 Tax=Klugiella xanthotipulae TaxID=244735 RepID=A0A543I4H8_9MICO|nr:MarR family winged helix-turn-helix transcriptional regulator [Klugiella xanthotipulae]TQM65469.1 DNA-binding MarR family transcriptional regulator [Klugiella xanthotipulae]
MTRDTPHPAGHPPEGDPARVEVARGVGEELAHLLASTRTLSQRGASLVHPHLQPAGLTVLRWVAANEPAQAGQVAATLDMDKSAVSRQLRALRDFGLVEGEPDPEDGRAMLLRLTPAGRTQLDKLRVLSREKFYSRLDGWSLEDMEALRRYLERLNRGT